VPTDIRRTVVLSVGFVVASLVGLAGCGSAAPSVVAPTPAAPASVAAPPASATPAPTPSPRAGAACTPVAIKFDPAATIDLTGTWAGNDAGIYYVRQRGNVIWWNGMSSRDLPPEALGRDWNNVGRGVIADDLTITSDWSDVPRGQADGTGSVIWKIGPNGSGNIQIERTSLTGDGRGDTLWVPCTLE